MNSIRTWSLATNCEQTKVKKNHDHISWGFLAYKFLWLHREVQWYLGDTPPRHRSPVGMDKFEQIRPDLQEEEKQCDHRPQGEDGGKQSDVLEELNQEQGDFKP